MVQGKIRKVWGGGGGGDCNNGLSFTDKGQFCKFAMSCQVAFLFLDVWLRVKSVLQLLVQSANLVRDYIWPDFAKGYRHL